MDAVAEEEEDKSTQVIGIEEARGGGGSLQKESQRYR